MKKVQPVPFHALYEKNDNMYQNVMIVSKRARNIISENVLDLDVSSIYSKVNLVVNHLCYWKSLYSFRKDCYGFRNGLAP